MTIRSLLVAAALVAAQATPAQATTAQATPAVGFLGHHVLPHKLQYAGTTVGGLSGIDRDPETGEYVLISDDRSNINPVRVYTASVDTGGVEITGVRTLTNPEGAPYPPNAVDPEDVRVDPLTGQYWWSQEGNRGPPSSSRPSSAASVTAPTPVASPCPRTTRSPRTPARAATGCWRRSRSTAPDRC
ncbi:esterase-like activity of phytase family protein [Actinosynnema sp. CA-248983]